MFCCHWKNSSDNTNSSVHSKEILTYTVNIFLFTTACLSSIIKAAVSNLPNGHLSLKFAEYSPIFEMVNVHMYALNKNLAPYWHVYVWVAVHIHTILLCSSLFHFKTCKTFSHGHVPVAVVLFRQWWNHFRNLASCTAFRMAEKTKALSPQITLEIIAAVQRQPWTRRELSEPMNFRFLLQPWQPK